MLLRRTFDASSQDPAAGSEFYERILGFEEAEGSRPRKCMGGPAGWRSKLVRSSGSSSCGPPIILLAPVV
jgi:hypothetical protein